MGKRNLNITVCAIVFAIILMTVSGRTAVYADSTEGQPEVTETTAATVNQDSQKRTGQGERRLPLLHKGQNHKEQMEKDQRQVLLV